MTASRSSTSSATVPDFATDPVTVRVGSAGICASDLKMLPWKLPVTLGHEFAGVLDDGTVVAVQPNAPCGTCAVCFVRPRTPVPGERTTACTASSATAGSPTR